MRRRIPVALVGGLVLFAALGGLVGRAGAAGVTTHTWMAMQAVPRVTDPDLQALLQANALQLQSGAHFPDSGYAPGLTGPSPMRPTAATRKEYCLSVMSPVAVKRALLTMPMLFHTPFSSMYTKYMRAPSTPFQRRST